MGMIIACILIGVDRTRRLLLSDEELAYLETQDGAGVYFIHGMCEHGHLHHGAPPDYPDSIPIEYVDPVPPYPGPPAVPVTPNVNGTGIMSRRGSCIVVATTPNTASSPAIASSPAASTFMAAANATASATEVIVGAIRNARRRSSFFIAPDESRVPLTSQVAPPPTCASPVSNTPASLSKVDESMEPLKPNAE
ncbi:hypothetical protein HK102_005895 [Quaeritorhiza haematococci]|nr:hypothetical protein HK102_005895 [Quaeritorhiza haematococci]